MDGGGRAAGERQEDACPIRLLKSKHPLISCVSLQTGNEQVTNQNKLN